MKLSTSLIGLTAGLLLASTPAFAALTASEIGTLATIATIDAGEILISDVAIHKHPNSGIEDFAKMMIDQHGSNLTQILEMAAANKITALTGGESDKLMADNKKGLMKLGALQGKEFDTAYANAMVSGHEGALNLIDKKLMPTAKSEEMKKFMTDTRAVVAGHLEHAKKLQADMK